MMRCVIPACLVCRDGLYWYLLVMPLKLCVSKSLNDSRLNIHCEREEMAYAALLEKVHTPSTTRANCYLPAMLLAYKKNIK